MKEKSQAHKPALSNGFSFKRIRTSDVHAEDVSAALLRFQNCLQRDIQSPTFRHTSMASSQAPANMSGCLMVCLDLIRDYRQHYCQLKSSINKLVETQKLNFTTFQHLIQYYHNIVVKATESKQALKLSNSSLEDKVALMQRQICQLKNKVTKSIEQRQRLLQDIENMRQNQCNSARTCIQWKYLASQEIQLDRNKETVPFRINKLNFKESTHANTLITSAKQNQQSWVDNQLNKSPLQISEYFPQKHSNHFHKAHHHHVSRSDFIPASSSFINKKNEIQLKILHLRSKIRDSSQ